MSDWVSDGISGLALVIAALAAFYSRNAVRAARDSADSSRRSADVAERKEQREVAEAARTAVNWELTPYRTQMAESYGVRLVNRGTETAYDVHMDLPRHAQVVGPSAPDGTTVPPGASAKVEVAMFAGVRDATIALSWRVDHGGFVQSQTYDFPL